MGNISLPFPPENQTANDTPSMLFTKNKIEKSIFFNTETTIRSNSNMQNNNGNTVIDSKAILPRIRRPRRKSGK